MNRTLKRLLAITSIVAAPLVAAAGTPTEPATEPPPSETTTTTPTGPTTAPAAAPTDAEIAHIVVTANDIDIEDARLARRRTENPAVSTFAERMIGDHTTLNDQAKDLTSRLDLSPVDNDVSKQMKADNDQALAMLKELEGAAFDKAYVDREIVFHANVLDQIDRVLTPNAQDPDLRKMLEGARPLVAAHLEHARQLQQQLMTPGAAPVL